MVDFLLDWRNSLEPYSTGDIVASSHLFLDIPVFQKWRLARRHDGVAKILQTVIRKHKLEFIT
jgi:hypothetical protein